MDRKKKQYKKPKIVYEKKMETVAAVCDSTWVGPGGTCCMKGTCLRRSS